MASLGNSKEFAKRDINFFDEFTAGARKQAQLMGMFVFVLIILVAAFVLWVGFYIVTNIALSSEVKNLKEELNSDQYKSLELEYSNLQTELSSKTRYFYSLSEMRNSVDQLEPANSGIADLIGNSIPNDTYIEKYTITGDTLHIEGFTFSYYSYVDLVNILNESDCFTSAPDIMECTIYPWSELIPEVVREAINSVDVYYSFVIEGGISRNAYVQVGRFLNGDTVEPLEGNESQVFSTGDIFSVSDIATYEESGVVYSLNSVTINGVGASSAELESYISNNEITGIARGTIVINLYYAPANSGEGEA